MSWVYFEEKIKTGSIQSTSDLDRCRDRFLVAFHIPYESYNEGAKYLSYLLTPATVCLAIPLYEQFELLKQNVAAILQD